MLSAHPRICIPDETEFFMQVAPGLRGDPLRRAFGRYIRSQPFRQQDLDAEEILVAAGDQMATPRTLFLEMMSRQARRAGKPRVGEKSPHHCRHVERIAAELPHAKFIHIYRDVRDVAASRLHTSWSSPSVIAHARSWTQIIREHHRLMSIMPPDRYCEVRFETLLESPERELRRLCEFLGEAFDADMLRFHERARAGIDRGEAAWGGSALNPLDGDAVGRHRGRLSPRQIQAVQRIAGREMDRLGYAVVPIRLRPTWLVVNAAERIRHRLASIGRSIRKRLPA
jgi:hypothetical protein